jgi:hypothetical protein
MLRTALIAVLFAASSSAALAQAKAAKPGQFTPPPPGSYSGSVKDANGARMSNVKLDIRDVTKDGRVTAHIAASNNVPPMCVKSLPASGIMLDDNSMRLEVDAGAPEGCERIYNVKAASGKLSGTFVDSKSVKK